MWNSVFQILLLLVSLQVQASGAAPPLAKPGCQESCGNVTIPFPFGIGAGCFLDDWYEILCQENSMVPVLNKIGLRVLNLSLPYIGYMNGMAVVPLPIIYQNACAGQGPVAPVSLEGSQFVFSQTWNVFKSVGCNTLAIVNGTESAVVGCRLKCAGTDSTISRCQTTLPFNLRGFSVDFKEEAGPQECNFAYLAATANLTGLNIYERYNDSVPVVLEWGIANDTYFALELIRQSYTTDPFYCERTNLYRMYEYRTYEYLSEMPFTQCYCAWGYSGNPYLTKGCQDIDECENSNLCPGTCVNKPGDFKCVDGRKTAKFILIGLGAGVGGLVQVLLLSRWLYKVIKKRRVMKQKEKYFKTQWGLLLQQHLSSSPEGNVAKSKLFRCKGFREGHRPFQQG